MAAATFVRLLSGLKSSISWMMYSMCLRPFLGGMYFSMRSEKKMTPILSLFCMALNAKMAAISVAISRLVRSVVPKSSEPLTSMSSITVSSRSSSNTLTKGRRKRAVTFQSMSRTSSPTWYSRTSEKAIPRPLKAEWYCPAKILLLNPRVFISIFRTCLNSSSASI